MPTDEEIEAAAREMHRVNKNTKGLMYTDLMKEMAKAALEAAEKVRGDGIYEECHELHIAHDKLFDIAEAAAKREEKLREALEKIFKLIYKCEYFDSVQAECGIIAKQILQTEEQADA